MKLTASVVRTSPAKKLSKYMVTATVSMRPSGCRSRAESIQPIAQTISSTCICSAIRSTRIDCKFVPSISEAFAVSFHDARMGLKVRCDR